MKTRLVWADVLRIIAIYLVIVVHTSLPPESPWDIQHIWPFLLSSTIANTCVPLFVMLSGALLLSKKETYRLFFKKRIMKVVIPWIVWTFLYMFINYQFHDYRPTTLSEWKYFFERTFLSELWFIPMIVSLYLLTPLLRLIIPHLKKTDKWYLVLSWFVWVSVLPFLHASPAFPNPSTGGLLALALFYAGYFFLGHFLVTLNYFKKKLGLPLGIIGLGIILTCIEVAFLKDIKEYNSVYNYFAPNIVITSIGMFLIIYHLFTYRLVNVTLRLKKLLILVSNASLGIYIVHGLVKELFDPTLMHYVLNYFTALPLIKFYLHALIILILSFLFVQLLKQIPLLKKIVP